MSAASWHIAIFILDKRSHSTTIKWKLPVSQKNSQLSQKNSQLSQKKTLNYLKKTQKNRESVPSYIARRIGGDNSLVGRHTRLASATKTLVGTPSPACEFRGAKAHR